MFYAYYNMKTDPYTTFGSSAPEQAETPTSPINRKILVIDDDEAILTTYRNILQPRTTGTESLFNLLGERPQEVRESFEVVTATQGQIGVTLVEEALSTKSPFSVVFVDMRMPPGWDGLRTARVLRALDPNLYIVVASAYADYTADQIQAALNRDAVLLRKPFGRDEVYQLARTLAQGWTNRRALQDLNRVLEARLVAAHAADRRQHNERRRHLALGQVLAEISTRLSSMGEKSLTQGISWFLEQVGRITEVEHCYLVLWKDEKEVAIHEYCAPTMTPDNNIDETVVALRAMLEAGTMITGIPLVSTSAMVVALFWNGQPRGLLGCEAVDRKREWHKDDVDLLATSACILSRVLENFDVVRTLRECQSLFQALAVSSPVGIIRTDTAGRCTYSNERAATLLGHAVDGCLGTEWSTYLHPDDRDWVLHGWEAVRTHQTPFRGEYRFRHEDGSQLWVIGTAIPQYDDAGNVVGFVGTLTDITEFKTK